MTYLKRALQIAGLIAVGCGSPAMAGRQTGTLAYISADKTFGTGVVTFSVIGGASSDKPACAAGADARWALNVGDNAPANQYIYSLIVSSMSSTFQISVTGTGKCATVSNLEDVAYVEVRK
ncbi:hypothetical protein [Sphingomonas sp. RIT328]|uniref:hypothetical protein n=1 Tax=Sphingomonas sp. RIT328 TaxID=1470591 RepID=UPI0012694C66|nr:hypothetical protein [Sphingomonas sp. RIT328]